MLTNELISSLVWPLGFVSCLERSFSRQNDGQIRLCFLLRLLSFQFFVFYSLIHLEFIRVTSLSSHCCHNTSCSVMSLFPLICKTTKQNSPNLCVYSWICRSVLPHYLLLCGFITYFYNIFNNPQGSSSFLVCFRIFLVTPAVRMLKLFTLQLPEMLKVNRS